MYRPGTGRKVVNVDASFACSWSSRGWSARDGLVAAVSEDTGKLRSLVRDYKGIIITA